MLDQIAGAKRTSLDKVDVPEDAMCISSPGLAHKRYANTAEVKADFPSVDFIGEGKAVFNICRNKYRLVVEMNLRRRGLALVRHVVTHAEYDRLIARKRL